MYKIYINDKQLIFANESSLATKWKVNSAILSESVDLIFNNDFTKLLEAHPTTIINTLEPEKSFKKFSKNLKLIEAAGGIVYDKNEENILFIFRREKWDLPKGKVDEGENIEDAAWREVSEECGIHSHKIISLFDVTYHIYFFKNEWVLKKTYWYNMKCADVEALTPQAEEDITAIEWISKNNLDKVKSNTYAMIQDIIENL